MNWRRIIGWALIILVAANMIGLISGGVMAHSRIDPATIDRLVKCHRIARMAAIAMVAIVCYWRLGANSSLHRAASIFAAFLLIQFADIGLSLMLGARVNQLFDPWAVLRSGSYALIGYALARRWPNASTESITPADAT